MTLVSLRPGSRVYHITEDIHSLTGQPSNSASHLGCSGVPHVLCCYHIRLLVKCAYTHVLQAVGTTMHLILKFGCYTSQQAVSVLRLKYWMMQVWVGLKMDAQEQQAHSGHKK